jgi:hypothetical protein
VANELQREGESSANCYSRDDPSHYITPEFSRLLSLKLTFEDGTDKEFRNIFVNQSKPHNVGKPKKVEISLGGILYAVTVFCQA